MSDTDIKKIGDIATRAVRSITRFFSKEGNKRSTVRFSNGDKVDTALVSPVESVLFDDPALDVPAPVSERPTSSSARLIAVQDMDYIKDHFKIPHLVVAPNQDGFYRLRAGGSYVPVNLKDMRCENSSCAISTDAGYFMRGHVTFPTRFDLEVQNITSRFDLYDTVFDGSINFTGGRPSVYIARDTRIGQISFNGGHPLVVVHEDVPSLHMTFLGHTTVSMLNESPGAYKFVFPFNAAQRAAIKLDHDTPTLTQNLLDAVYHLCGFTRYILPSPTEALSPTDPEFKYYDEKFNDSFYVVLSYDGKKTYTCDLAMNPWNKHPETFKPFNQASSPDSLARKIMDYFGGRETQVSKRIFRNPRER